MEFVRAIRTDARKDKPVMKNIYFVQAILSNDNLTVYLPYASACLIAYAKSDKDIASAYRFHDILFMRDPIETAAQSLVEPYLVAFSCIIGNVEYSKVLAAKIKERYPACHIVFGGHGVSDTVLMMKTCSFIDFIIRGEGEHAFAALLKALYSNGGYEDIPNLTYRAETRILVNKTENKYDLDSYPSPYAAGVFDPLVKKHPDVTFHAVVETNRGCPYHCAFCEWCYTENIRYFPMERVHEDLEWMSRNHIEYCYCADANFGIHPRDTDIAKLVVQMRKKTGYPSIFRPTYSKNSNETVFEAGKILNLNGADKGVTIAYQSLNQKTLELIGRKDMDIHHFAQLERRYAAHGIPTYTELILGLPGETYDSFCEGLCRLLEAGQHNSVAVYQCQIYDNALLGNPAYQKEHGIQTARVPFHGIHYIANFNGVPEYYDIVIGTADMDTEEWVKANLFSVVIQAFHHLGLLRCFALYLRYEHQVDYDTFYSRLLSFVLNATGTRMQKILRGFEDRLRDIATGDWTYTDNKFGRYGWYFEEALFLELLSGEDNFWADVLPFLAEFSLTEDVSKALLNYQQFVLRRPNTDLLSAEFPFDFYSYFERIYSGTHAPLETRNCRITVRTGISVSSWEEYALKIILGGKRRGETLYTNEKNAVEVTFLPSE